MPSNGFYNIKDLAKILKLTSTKIKSMVINNQIPYYEFEGEVRFSSDEIEKWVKARKAA